MLRKQGSYAEGLFVELFRAAADRGHAVATAWLANCLWYGKGVEQNRAKARQLARLALDERGLQAEADQGDAAAQDALGEMYRDGRGFDQDHGKALALFLQAAGQGDADAQCSLCPLGYLQC